MTGGILQFDYNHKVDKLVSTRILLSEISDYLKNVLVEFYSKCTVAMRRSTLRPAAARRESVHRRSRNVDFTSDCQLVVK